MWPNKRSCRSRIMHITFLIPTSRSSLWLDTQSNQRYPKILRRDMVPKEFSLCLRLLVNGSYGEQVNPCRIDLERDSYATPNLRKVSLLLEPNVIILDPFQSTIHNLHFLVKQRIFIIKHETKVYEHLRKQYQ